MPRRLHAAFAMTTVLLVHQPSPARTVKMPHFDATDLAVCKLATSLSPEEFSNYAVKNLVTPTGLKISPTQWGGIMHMSVGAKGTQGKDVSVAELGRSADGEVRGDEFLSSRILPYAGRVYFLSYAGMQPLYLLTITRFLPGGRVMPVCDVKPHVEVDLRTSLEATNSIDSRDLHTDDQEICDHVKQGNVTYLSEQEYADSRPIPSDPMMDLLAVASVTVDFRNSGTAETIEVLAGSSGSPHGCFSSVKFVAPGMTWDHNDPVLDHLQDRQSSYSTNRFPSSEECRDGPVRWLTYKGKTYLETQSYNSLEPEDEFQEYWFVSTAEAGHVRRVCEPSYVHDLPTLTVLHKNGRLIEQ